MVDTRHERLGNCLNRKLLTEMRCLIIISKKKIKLQNYYNMFDLIT